MTEYFHDGPFHPLLTAIPYRGTRDDALNAFHPQVDLGDPEGGRFGSSPESSAERWIALLFCEEEADLLLRITEMVKGDKEVSAESRYMAEKINQIVKACIQDFTSYEEREAAEQPASIPVTS